MHPERVIQTPRGISCCHFSKKIPFITIFPQFKHYYQKYEKVINAAVDKIHEDMNNKVKKIKKKEEIDQQIVSVNTDDIIVEKIYSKFTDIVKNHYQVGDKNSKKTDINKTDKKNIRSIVTNLRYLEILYQLI